MPKKRRKPSKAARRAQSRRDKAKHMASQPTTEQPTQQPAERQGWSLRGLWDGAETTAKGDMDLIDEEMPTIDRFEKQAETSSSWWDLVPSLFGGGSSEEGPEEGPGEAVDTASSSVDEGQGFPTVINPMMPTPNSTSVIPSGLEPAGPGQEGEAPAKSLSSEALSTIADKVSISTKLGGQKDDSQVKKLADGDVGGKYGKLGYDASLGKGQYKTSAKAKASLKGLSVSGKGEASASLLDANTEFETPESHYAQAKAELSGQLGHVGGELSASGKLGMDGVSAKASGEAGAYLAKVSGEAEGGFRIPFTNIKVGGGVEAEAGLGVGGKFEGGVQANKDGFGASLKGGLFGGFGGSAGLKFNIGKQDKRKGWLDSSAPEPEEVSEEAPEQSR